MSDLSEAFGMKTEATPEYTELFNQLLFAELTANTEAILSILRDEGNNVPLAVIEDEKEGTDGLLIEELDQKPNVLGIRLLDSNNGSKFVIEVSTDDDVIFAQPISKNTFTQLRGLAIDPDIAVVNVKSKLSHAI